MSHFPPAPVAGAAPLDGAGSAALTYSGTAVDIGHALDDGPYALLQRIAAVLAALSIVVDGFDSQLIGFAIPVLIKEWGITRNAFAPVVAAGLIGMGIGSAFAGLFADRFGRRWAVIGSVLVFGAATCAIGLAPNVATIAALRFVAGLGIGGALPTSTTITAEFTPARHRTFAVTATIVCVPLGGMVAGLFAGQVLPAYGWRGLFFAGGVLPLLLAVVLLATLPESPRFLARRPQRWPELVRLLARMGRAVPPDAAFTDVREQRAEQHIGFTALFRDGRARDTAAIWAAFFMCLLAVYSAFSWLPTMLTNEGLSVSLAGYGLSAYNLGGVIGALVCALAISRYGSRWPLLLCCAGGAVSAWIMLGVGATQHTALLIVGLGLHGLFVNAVQSTMYALCAFVYPTGVRATGTASALAFGRIGAILSAFAGALVITAAGASGYLLMLGAAMALVLLALAVVRRHIPGRTKASRR
ncbi:MFS transporter [Paraburkholderia phenazinium]|jgi:AAHS family 4-hydroxybenzoate transporter-like MFS transporter|uniref:MFS transporter, AAHS family, 4-hydroxybenzoate transporter n=1 Tax=Paraburkholderia phenazinium TaxID=60549 RepID=A0A1G7TPI1_9BURK|nr:MFS transporter [Paraburkholderia phenazinium]SDG36924.1 MFS transporter, AAHS family, 4-hydroxybenzoate transporter [Paraburkholderia phenazinium]